MANKSVPSNAQTFDVSTVPVFYADQPAALALGPHVSKLTFGVEEADDGDYPRPVVTIAMPTGALLQFVNDLKKALDAPSFKKRAVLILEKTAKAIAAGGHVTPPHEFLELEKRPVSKKSISRSK